MVRVSRGIPQRSVLGPLIWIIVYDELLKVGLSPDAVSIGFCDDMGIVVRDSRLDRLTNKVYDIMMIFES